MWPFPSDGPQRICSQGRVDKNAKALFMFSSPDLLDFTDVVRTGS